MNDRRKRGKRKPGQTDKETEGSYVLYVCMYEQFLSCCWALRVYCVYRIDDFLLLCLLVRGYVDAVPASLREGGGEGLVLVRII